MYTGWIVFVILSCLSLSSILVLHSSRSSMGSQQGFLGKSVMAFAIFCSLVKALRPTIVFHECTRLFNWKIFDSDDNEDDPSSREPLLGSYQIHSTLVDPTEFGFPIHRSRCYSAIIRDDHVLGCGLNQLFRLHISSTLDAGVFFAAPMNEANGR